MDTPKTDNNTITYAAQTDTGKQRTNNEDNWVCRNIWDENTLIAAVIDGVGGYEGGEVAAKIAAEELVSYLEKYPNGERAQLLKEAVVYANNHIFEERNNNPQIGKMGCVMTAILIEQDKALVHMAHVGDTRLYEYNGGCLIKRSHDQSPVGKYEEMGKLTEREAMEHPLRSMIERDLGHKQLDNATEDYIETNSFPLEGNTVWLLCSDGLTDLVTAAEITEILSTDETPAAQAQLLVDAANEAGGKDNVTAVVLQVPGAEKQAVPQETDTEEDTPVPTETATEKPPVQEPATNGKKEKRFSHYLLQFLTGTLLFAAGWIAHGLYIIHTQGTKVEQITPEPYPAVQDSLPIFFPETATKDTTNGEGESGDNSLKH